MADSDALALEDLVRAYTLAHQERIRLSEGAERRMLWTSPPVKDEYDAVTRAIRTAAPRPRHSDASVEAYVDALLQAALNEPAGTADEVRRLLDVLDHPVVTRLYIPLDGIAVEEAEVRLGSVRLVRMDDDAFERLIIGPYSDIIRVDSVEEQARANAAIERQRKLLESLRGRTCVEVTTDIDLTGTFAQADTVADEVCDFLQMCVAVLSPRVLTNPVRWSNGIVGAWSSSFGVSDGPRPRSNSNVQLAYGGPPTVIDAAALAKVQEYGLSPLADGLGTARTTEYATLLRRGVRWFAKGERERHADDRKLAYVTAVDLFFSEPGPGATKRFCDGFAFVMRDDPAGVAYLARLMYGVYDSRSVTSHKGVFDLESHEGVDRLRWRVLEFLARMAGHAFQTKADIATWIAERRKALTKPERHVLNDATLRKVVNQDVALRRSIGLIGGELSMVPFDNAARERVVLRKLLTDALRDRNFLLELRPLAHDLQAALADAHQSGDDPVPVALAALASLAWVADALRTRLASDFT